MTKRGQRDIWSVRGALKKYAKGKAFDWKRIRKEAEASAAAHQVRVLRESRSR